MAVSAKRNSPTDVISRISQISKIMRERRLWFAVLLEKNYVTELFLEIFRNFHLIIINIFMKSGYISSLLAALQPVRCKPESLVEREFLAVSRRATFGKYIPRNSVLYKTVDWINVSCYFTKMWFHRSYYPSNFKNFRKHLQRCQFSVQLQVVGWAAAIAEKELQ